MLNINAIKSLHKKETFDIYYEIDEDLFTEGDQKIFDTLKKVYKIDDVYNNYFIDIYGNKIKPDTLTEKTTLRIHSGKKEKIVRCGIKPTYQAQLKKDLMALMAYMKKGILTKPDSEKQQYINFEYRPNVDITQTTIYKAFNNIWSKWNLIDVVNNMPIIDSMCKVVAYIFTPDRSWRYFAVVESSCSGWGKTGFFNSLCQRTQLFVHSVNQVQEVDRFEYTEMYKGQDVCLIDDPAKNIHQLAGEINNIIANRKGSAREMQRMAYTVDGIDTKIVVTTNIPFRVKQDVQLNNKMICVKTNDVPNRDDKEQKYISDLIGEVINNATDDEINDFISGCVDSLDQDSKWISSHLGLHTEADELGTKILEVFDLIRHDWGYTVSPAITTLEDLVKQEFKSNGDSYYRIKESRLEELKISYTIICNELKKVDFSAQCKYYGRCLFMTGSQPKQRARNFKLTKTVCDFICKMATLSDDTITPAQDLNTPLHTPLPAPLHDSEYNQFDDSRYPF